jgi:sialic acid synthase SpsE
MEPEPFKRYVHDLRKSKAACLAHEDKVGPEELEVRNRARRSLYAARELQPGTVVRESDVLIVRPPGPLPPSAFRIVLGQTVRRTIHRYEALTLEALERTNEPIHNK